MHSSYLNPSLHARLQANYSDVKVTNAGMPGRSYTIPDWGRGGRLTTRYEGEAEHYHVNCPFCGDQRGRLAIHYRFGTPDPATNRPVTHLVYCHNETHCMEDRENREQLHLSLFQGISLPVLPLILSSSPQLSASGSLQLSEPCDLPEGLPINDEQIPSEVRSYISQRRFDVNVLWKRWRVLYCAADDSCSPKISRRIVAPYFQHRAPLDSSSKLVIVGYVARLVESDEVRVGSYNPKYLMPRGFKKSRYLYGLHRVLKQPGPIVVVEGITDVWRLRSNAVAVIGTDVSNQQRNLLAQLGRRRPIVVFFDNDPGDTALQMAENVAAQLRQLQCPEVYVAQPPAGRQDVGECTRLEAWKAVARSMGTTVKKLGIDWLT